MSVEIITLRAEGSVLDVAPGQGGCIHRYATEVNGRTLDWLRPAVGTVATDTSCFPLVPFSNRIKNGEFSFGGHDVKLPPNFPPEPHAIHGHGWQNPWSVVDVGDDRLTIEYVHPADEWPFPYLALQTFELSDVLQVTFEVVNTGDEEMPVGFGIHPYFVRTEKTRITAPVNGVWLSGEDAMPSQHVELPADMQLPTGIDPNDVSLDNNFTGWEREALIEWLDRDARLTLTAEEPFGVLIVYTPPGESFACVEPATNVIDAFNLETSGRTDTGTIHLHTGQRRAATVTFAPEF